MTLRSAAATAGRLYHRVAIGTGVAIATGNAISGAPLMAEDVRAYCANPSDDGSTAKRAVRLGTIVMPYIAFACYAKAYVYATFWPVSVLLFAERARRAVRDQDHRWLLPPVTPLCSAGRVPALHPYLFVDPQPGLFRPPVAPGTPAMDLAGPLWPANA